MAKGRRTGGRQKGTPNKSTEKIKLAICQAFTKLGGVSALVEWGRKDANRGEFYKLWGRMAPQEHTGEGGGPVVVAVKFSNE
jgi:hypothetical protein